MSANAARLGLIFMSTTVIFWGVMPIALKLSAEFIDPVTLTWFRFGVAFVATLLQQCLLGGLQQFAQLRRRDWLKLALAALLLIGNYVSFVFALKYLAPGTVQLNFQTSSFFLALGGVLFFGERFSRTQLLCFSALAGGMLLFFNPFLSGASGAGKVLVGVAIVQLSVISWVSYALLQKSLGRRLSPANVLLFIYGFSLPVLLPFSDISPFYTMNIEQWWIAIFCAVSTLVAYGCFGQAMKYWPAAQVGALMALTPVLSFAATDLVGQLGWWRGSFSATPLNLLSQAGIVLIVLSVMLVQLLPHWQQRQRHCPQN
ncbi:DMT family transporter [Shewanella fodinae]|uniref:EamA domain-containing membrane protein RarD n=1 Tax=Shewanella fodinae TaxID=552357 RepID=A0A4R2FIC4_9GAMM|nr:DMT family transporter [Shewanella fodinae]TCN90645.1 EamA domain-containing membrane protein RarD [Shewanella fodinae]